MTFFLIKQTFQFLGVSVDDDDDDDVFKKKNSVRVNTA